MSGQSSNTSKSFEALVKTRARATLLMTAIILVLLSVNMLLMSSWSEVGARPVYDGSNISIVLAYSIFVIVFGAVIAAIYIWWANTVLDDLVQNVRDEILGGEEP